ncbi:FIST C-terminal domain-containing protein [Thermodesulfobacterium hveragerdense]|uniref:FIST C-terminal domain-containing protein n=1 Tax=Thermodesulfobacterium hveragerdense TaxID=53424 RepID=UPI000428A197|nr:FIST C-terminal domain-containing protein [Thermodesulfobacterium hveragerdense]
MKALVFQSREKTLSSALEDIKKQIDKHFDTYDFLIFAVSPDYPYNDINYYIKKVFNTEKNIGFHAIHSFCDSEIVEGISVAVIKFERTGKVEIFYLEGIDENEAVIETANYFNSNSDKLHIIIGGLGNKKRFGTFIEEVSQFIDFQPVNNIIGGISSGYRDANGEVLSYQFVDSKIIKNGFVIITFSNIDFAIDIALGFKPYGVTYEIKKAKDYKLYLVDENRNFSDITRSLIKGIDNFDIRYLWYIPIYILDDEEGYVATLRTFKKVEKDYVEFFGPIKEGQKLKLSFATAEELLQENLKIAKRVKERIGHSEIVFDFSCTARQYVLEERQKEEAEIYTSILNSNLFGFFTYGEIGPDRYFKKLKFYNETSIVLAMKER